MNFKIRTIIQGLRVQQLICSKEVKEDWWGGIKDSARKQKGKQHSRCRNNKWPFSKSRKMCGPVAFRCLLGLEQIGFDKEPVSLGLFISSRD